MRYVIHLQLENHCVRILSLGGVGAKTWGTKVEIMGDVKAFLHSTPPPNMF